MYVCMYVCMSEDKASHSHKTWTEVSSSVPHLEYWWNDIGRGHPKYS